ncbi:MAG: 30S ribosomal protein S12 methylthiotransferase RimO [Ignavibacteria bacterium]|jgi:ribosomal protein S12 methylthiotransferase|nr:30S ribosomal protein S12 methylthiotransferase RimO [Ignavibacteria bacterium]MCU7504177.1 30S ribosomal protein S12 methylthiotransferase RimO [Ignavibacteria bacterium]MCU7516373.1 30S ribosomal protein S12 methylthiotransferase RimO [Ignavibacteria bacterium]
MKKKQKVGVITLGCSKNVVDSERLMNQLINNNCELTDDPEKAEVVIINTCGFIEAAKEESINTILNAVEMKKNGSLKKVIVSGCLSERYKSDLEKEIPEVDVYFGTEDYGGILKELGGELKYELLGERVVTTPRHLAYLKISEGCNNPCSFCAIPLIRGKHVSRPMEQLVDEAGLLAQKGTKELVVIGQDTTDYGIDIYGRRNLAELLDRLSGIQGLEWIRLLYAYPSHFPKDVLEVIKNNPKVCKYLDMPLQHISDGVLKSMRRGITSRRTREMIDQIRQAVPDIALRTTFIVGYPAETEKDFNELCEFVKEYQFDKVGVFTYSVEENTTGFILGDPVSEEVKEERKAILMELQKEISLAKNRELIGKNLRVIVDGFEGSRKDGYYIARSMKDAPEVDGEVLIPAKEKLMTGSFYELKVYDCNEYDLYGEVLRI